MLTGDAKAVGESVAKQLGLDEVHAELLPADKVERVEELLKQKSANGKLAFVGDGINDAPVLSRADIGIAMGGLGSDAAIEAADVVLMDDQPSKIATAMRISKKTLRIVQKQHNDDSFTHIHPSRFCYSLCSRGQEYDGQSRLTGGYQKAAGRAHRPLPQLVEFYPF